MLEGFSLGPMAYQATVSWCQQLCQLCFHLLEWALNLESDYFHINATIAPVEMSF